MTDAMGKEGNVDARTQTQIRTYTNWINEKLKKTDYSVKEITEDLKDGVILSTLLLILDPGKEMPGR